MIFAVMGGVNMMSELGSGILIACAGLGVKIENEKIV